MADDGYLLRFGDDFRKFCTITRGETRSLAVTIRHAKSLFPVDLTSADVMVSFPREGGGSIKRRSFPLTFVPALVASTTPSAVDASGHGFVSGDFVTVMAAYGATMPTGLTNGGFYLISAIDADTFGFTDMAGNPITLADEGSGAISVTLQLGCSVPTPVNGTANVGITYEMAQALNVGQGQKMQVTLISGNTVRVILAPAALDVYDQPYP